MAARTRNLKLWSLMTFSKTTDINIQEDNGNTILMTCLEAKAFEIFCKCIEHKELNCINVQNSSG